MLFIFKFAYILNTLTKLNINFVINKIFKKFWIRIQFYLMERVNDPCDFMSCGSKYTGIQVLL